MTQPTPTTVQLARTPAVPPMIAEPLLPGLAAVPHLDSYNQLTRLVLTVHTASGTAIGGLWCPDCRRRNLTHLTGVDWTRPLDQLATDPAVAAAGNADHDASAACTADDHDCGTGHCLPWDEHRLILAAHARQVDVLNARIADLTAHLNRAEVPA
ncbi:hypothetical protein [Micromonospora sp. NPDC023814]|uniref:hypothetical protein n=1 Tax=Micromonospora sp. NPDC023814 TaxID=3154596 RepID=UPI0033FDDA29